MRKLFKLTIAAAVLMICMAMSACNKKSDFELSLTEGAHAGSAESSDTDGTAGTDRNASGGQDAGSGDQVTGGGVSISSDDQDAGTAAELPKGPIFVHICGAVRNPDVYQVPYNARLIDVVKLAGGFNDEADSDYHNLAGGLSDGQKIYVPTEQEVADGLVPEPELNTVSVPDADGASSGAAAGSETVDDETAAEAAESDRVNINTATAEELKTLNGIGDKRAQDIITYRTNNGGFKSIEDIKKVDGIKDGIFNKIKDYITI